MENIKISVIMPIYNTEKYLEETLDSILNQTMIDDIEVLMIDDGSCDNSRYIVEKYALDYDNFFSFHNKNIGQGRERNFGIKQARGEYIHFIDSDDYIIPTFYEELYDLAKKEDYDFAMCSISRFTKNSNWTDILYNAVFKDIEDKITSTNISKSTSLVYDTSPVNKIIKKSFLEDNQIYFPEEKIFYEDLLFSIKLQCLAKSVGILNRDLYFWRIRKDSSSVTQQREDIQNFKDRVAILGSIDEFLKGKGIDEKIINASYMKWLNHDIFIYIKEINNYSASNQKYLIDEVSRILNNISKDVLDDLNSDKRIIYKMIEENDIESLSSYFKEDYDLISNAETINDLEEKYRELDNFKSDCQNEKLVAKYVDIDFESVDQLEEIGNEPLKDLNIQTDLNNSEAILEEKPDLTSENTDLNKNESSLEETSAENPDLNNSEAILEEKPELTTENPDLNIYIETYIPYAVDKEKSKVEFSLIDSISKSEYSKVGFMESLKKDMAPIYKCELEGREDNIYKFSIPFEVIKNMNGQYNVLIKYKNEDFEKTALLTTNKPKKYFIMEDVEILSRFGLYRIFNLDVNEKQDSSIKINEINLRKTKEGNPARGNEQNLDSEYDKEFNIVFESDEKIDSLILEHLVTFKQMEYKTNSLNQTDNGYSFEVSLPFKDMLEFCIRKWELKTKDNRRIQIEEAYKYKDDKIKINIKNQENRLFILIEYYNKLQEIEKLENTIQILREKNQKYSQRNKRITNNNKILADKNQKLREKNNELRQRNKDLKNTIDEFKSRKVVRLADKFKF